jgi:hypothetical protein
LAVEFSFSGMAHHLVGLIKYAIVLVLMVVTVRVLLPTYWGHACYVDPDDLGMQKVLGKTTIKIPFDPGRWTSDRVARGDIVVVRRPASDDSGMLRGFPFRVVAVAGDSIEAYRGQFTVNGKPERYGGVKPIPDGQTNISARVLPRGYLYVLPDNRIECRGGHPCMIPFYQVVGRVDDEDL